MSQQHDRDYGEKRLERKAFLLGLVVTLSVFFTAMEWQTKGPSVLDLINFDDDVEVDMELLPKIEKNDMVSALVEEKAPEEDPDRIRKVDMELTAKQLAEALQFSPVESDAAEELEEKEEEVPPQLRDADGAELPERVLEELADFPGGYSELVGWLTKNLRYPSSSQNAKEKGDVIVEFIVEKDGSVSNVKLVKKAGTALNNEVSRVMKLMPAWKPATSKGMPARSLIRIPICFAM